MYINTSVSLAFVLLTVLKALRFFLGWNQLDRSVSSLFLNSSDPVVLQGDSLLTFQKISIFHQTLCRKYYKTWRLARNDQMGRKRNPGAQALHDSSFIPFFFFVWVLLFVYVFVLNCYLICVFFFSFVCFYFFYLRLNPLGHHTIVIRCSVVLPQGVNKFILWVTVSTNKMDVLANSVLHQIVWTIADIKMYADSTLGALRLAVFLFTGTHQLWKFFNCLFCLPQENPKYCRLGP